MHQALSDAPESQQAGTIVSTTSPYHDERGACRRADLQQHTAGIVVMHH